ncbi:sulfonate transport system permease protein [Microbacteriaceae bacterium MWH-Ta3]|nr:sulfonate transport system permease protein [Microbacteriaceae bacterium MWH-Ta3]
MATVEIGRTRPASGGNAAAKVRRTLITVAYGLVLPISIVAFWSWLAGTGEFSASQLPSPGDVLWAAGDLASRGVLLDHILISTQRVITGFGIGAGLGVILGSAVGLSPLIGRFLQPTIGAIRAVPSLAWVPLLLIWLGIYEPPKLTLIAIGAFFPVFTTVAAGFRAVDRNLIEVGRAYGKSGIALVTGVLLPAAAPTIFSGIRLGLAQSWLFLVAAELIASSKGLGYLLIDSQNSARTDILFLVIILLALLGKLTDFVVSLVEKRVLRWV